MSQNVQDRDLYMGGTILDRPDFHQISSGIVAPTAYYEVNRLTVVAVA